MCSWEKSRCWKVLAHIIKKEGVDVATFNEKTGLKGVESGDVVIVAIELRLIKVKKILKKVLLSLMLEQISMII
ncbi:hypothetical protein NWP96_03870 [Mycoplasmopsis cynos]|nr:hypothetical protein [Mycoplasmopsis cynos]